MPRYTTFTKVFTVCQSTRPERGQQFLVFKGFDSEWEAILQYRYEFGSNQ